VFGALKTGLQNEQNFDAAWKKVNESEFERMNQGPLTALWTRVGEWAPSVASAVDSAVDSVLDPYIP
jgi:hypothetical protein